MEHGSLNIHAISSGPPGSMCSPHAAALACFVLHRLSPADKKHFVFFIKKDFCVLTDQNKTHSVEETQEREQQLAITPIITLNEINRYSFLTSFNFFQLLGTSDYLLMIQFSYFYFLNIY